MSSPLTKSSNQNEEESLILNGDPEQRPGVSHHANRPTHISDHDNDEARHTDPNNRRTSTGDNHHTDREVNSYHHDNNQQDESSESEEAESPSQDYLIKPRSSLASSDLLHLIQNSHQTDPGDEDMTSSSNSTSGSVEASTKKAKDQPLSTSSDDSFTKNAYASQHPKPRLSIASTHLLTMLHPDYVSSSSESSTGSSNDQILPAITKPMETVLRENKEASLYDVVIDPATGAVLHDTSRSGLSLMVRAEDNFLLKKNVEDEVRKDNDEQGKEEMNQVEEIELPQDNVIKRQQNEERKITQIKEPSDPLLATPTVKELTMIFERENNLGSGSPLASTPKNGRSVPLEKMTEDPNLFKTIHEPDKLERNEDISPIPELPKKEAFRSMPRFFKTSLQPEQSDIPSVSSVRMGRRATLPACLDRTEPLTSVLKEPGTQSLKQRRDSHVQFTEEVDTKIIRPRSRSSSIERETDVPAVVWENKSSVVDSIRQQSTDQKKQRSSSATGTTDLKIDPEFFSQMTRLLSVPTMSKDIKEKCSRMFHTDELNTTEGQPVPETTSAEVMQALTELFREVTYQLQNHPPSGQDQTESVSGASSIPSQGSNTGLNFASMTERSRSEEESERIQQQAFLKDDSGVGPSFAVSLASTGEVVRDIESLNQLHSELMGVDTSHVFDHTPSFTRTHEDLFKMDGLEPSKLSLTPSGTPLDPVSEEPDGSQMKSAENKLKEKIKQVAHEPSLTTGRRHSENVQTQPSVEAPSKKNKTKSEGFLKHLFTAAAQRMTSKKESKEKEECVAVPSADEKVKRRFSEQPKQADLMHPGHFSKAKSEALLKKTNRITQKAETTKPENDKPEMFTTNVINGSTVCAPHSLSTEEEYDSDIDEKWRAILSWFSMYEPSQADLSDPHTPGASTSENLTYIVRELSSHGCLADTESTDEEEGKLNTETELWNTIKRSVLDISSGSSSSHHLPPATVIVIYHFILHEIKCGHLVLADHTLHSTERPAVVGFEAPRRIQYQNKPDGAPIGLPYDHIQQRIDARVSSFETPIQQHLLDVKAPEVRNNGKKTQTSMEYLIKTPVAITPRADICSTTKDTQTSILSLVPQKQQPQDEVTKSYKPSLLLQAVAPLTPDMFDGFLKKPSQYADEDAIFYHETESEAFRREYTSSEQQVSELRANMTRLVTHIDQLTAEQQAWSSHRQQLLDTIAKQDQTIVSVSKEAENSRNLAREFMNQYELMKQELSINNQSNEQKKTVLRDRIHSLEKKIQELEMVKEQWNPPVVKIEEHQKAHDSEPNSKSCQNNESKYVVDIDEMKAKIGDLRAALSEEIKRRQNTELKVNQRSLLQKQRQAREKTSCLESLNMYQQELLNNKQRNINDLIIKVHRAQDKVSQMQCNLNSLKNENENLKLKVEELEAKEKSARIHWRQELEKADKYKTQTEQLSDQQTIRQGLSGQALNRHRRGRQRHGATASR